MSLKEPHGFLSYLIKLRSSIIEYWENYWGPSKKNLWRHFAEVSGGRPLEKSIGVRLEHLGFEILAIDETFYSGDDKINIISFLVPLTGIDDFEFNIVERSMIGDIFNKFKKDIVKTDFPPFDNNLAVYSNNPDRIKRLLEEPSIHRGLIYRSYLNLKLGTKTREWRGYPLLVKELQCHSSAYHRDVGELLGMYKLTKATLEALNLKPYKSGIDSIR